MLSDLKELILLFFFITSLWIAAWKWGIIDSFIDMVVAKVEKGMAWYFSDEGQAGSLAEKLAYLDCFEDVFTTRDGNDIWCWTCFKVGLIPIDGFDNGELNQAGDLLNQVFTNLPAETWVQVAAIIENDADDACAVFRRIAKKSANTPLAPLPISRANHFRKLAREGTLRSQKTYVFIGRKLSANIGKVAISALWSSQPFIDFEISRFLNLREEVLQNGQIFKSSFLSAGGSSVEPVAASIAYEIVFKQMNPEESLIHKTPATDFFPEKVKAAKDEFKIGPEWAEPDSSGEVKFSTLRTDLFADNPNISLCLEPVKVKKGVFQIGDTFSTTISLLKLPRKVSTALIDRITRCSNINFPFYLVTHCLIGDTLKKDESLERKEFWLRLNIRSGGNNPNFVDEEKLLQIRKIRKHILEGEEKVVELGMTISFNASTLPELTRRRDEVFKAIRSMESAKGIQERHAALDIKLSSLPGMPFGDFRSHTALTQDAVALSSFTGATSGVDKSEATDVFLQSDGRRFFWNDRSSKFDSGMALMCGKSGSGKSATLNEKIATLLMDDHCGVTVDYGNSSNRLGMAVGANHYELSDLGRSRKFSLFNIYPRDDEKFKPEDLNQFGIPLERLSIVQVMVEGLCLDPNNPNEQSLSPELATFLYESVENMYRRLRRKTPILNDLIDQLAMAKDEHKEKAENLAGRLKLFAAQGPLGKFLNERADPIDEKAQYTIFNSKGSTDNPRLLLINSMIIVNFISRFVARSREIKKFIVFDEFSVVSKHPLVCRLIDIATRTARKANALVIIASQHPEDFKRNKYMDGILSNCEVLWLFKSQNPSAAEKVFELSIGEAKALRRLETGHPQSRDCIVIYPNGQRRGLAHLRFNFSPLEQRLVLGAGPKEKVSFEDAIADIKGNADAKLIAALKADALGATA